jgi:hypothetical protein
MRKENKTQKTETKTESKTDKDVKKLNLSFLEFIQKVREQPELLSNKENLQTAYFDATTLRFSNIQRVYKRVVRPVLSSDLLSELKAKNIELQDFLETSQKVVKLSRAKKESNYKTIEIPKATA